MERRTAFADARIEPEAGHPSGRILVLDGHEAGQVDLRDPRRLAFGYMRRIADVIDVFRPPGAPVDAVHVGGGAFALARYLAATRPRSTSEVYELDPGVVALAREHLRLRTSPRLRVREGDAAELLRARADRSVDIVIGDAFCDQAVPEQLAGRAYVADVRRVLRPSGVYVLNVIDEPPLLAARRHSATLAAIFPRLATIAPPGVLRGRAPGNLLLVASAAPLPVTALRRAAQAAIPREAVVEHLTGFPAGARV